MADIPEHGAETSPGPLQGEARAQRDVVGTGEPAPSVVSPSTRAVRVAWLLQRMQGETECAPGLPEARPHALNRVLRERYGIGATCATADIAEANRQVQEAIDEIAPTIGAQIKTGLTRIAQKAEHIGEYDVASSTLARLGKICGLEEKSDASKAGDLTHEQLQAAITQAVDRRVEQMSDEEFAAIAAKRAARGQG